MLLLVVWGPLFSAAKLQRRAGAGFIMGKDGKSERREITKGKLYPNYKGTIAGCEKHISLLGFLGNWENWAVIIHTS